MANSAEPMFLATLSRLPPVSLGSDLDAVFQSWWHYDCVLSPQNKQRLLNLKAQTAVAVPDCSDVATPISEPSAEEQSPSLREGFPLSLSVQNLHPLFRLMDRNNDGRVSLDEMMCVFRKLGKEVSESYLISLMEEFSRDGDLAVDFADFTALNETIFRTQMDGSNAEEDGLQEIDPELEFEEVLDTFNVYDKNGDGYICAAELAEVLRDLGFPEGNDLEKCQTLINRVDTDGNGLVDLHEFKEMLRPSMQSCAREANERSGSKQFSGKPPHRSDVCSVVM